MGHQDSVPCKSTINNPQKKTAKIQTLKEPGHSEEQCESEEQETSDPSEYLSKYAQVCQHLGGRASSESGPKMPSQTFVREVEGGKKRKTFGGTIG